VFEFADKYRGPYSSSLHAAVCPCYCDYSGYQDELLWGAAWLHKASRRREYREYIKRNEVVLGASDAINEFGWDNKHAGINVLISKVHLLHLFLFFFAQTFAIALPRSSVAQTCACCSLSEHPTIRGCLVFGRQPQLATPNIRLSTLGLVAVWLSTHTWLATATKSSRHIFFLDEIATTVAVSLSRRETDLGCSLMSEALASSALVSVVLRRGGVPYFGRFYAAISLLRTGQQASTWFAPVEGVISFSVGSGHVSHCTSFATWQNLDDIILSLALECLASHRKSSCFRKQL